MTTADAPPLEAATPAPAPRRRRINWFAERLDPAQLVGPMPPMK